MDYTVHGIFQARLLEWVAVPFSRGSSQPRDQTQVSHIAVRFLTSWPPRKPKNTGVGSLSLLQWIFLTQESNQGLLLCRQILYQLSCQGSMYAHIYIYIHVHINAHICVCVLSFSGISNSCNPWTVACQAPLSMQFSRQEYWVATSYFRGSSQPRNWTQVSYISCIGRQNLYHWVTWEAPFLSYNLLNLYKNTNKFMAQYKLVYNFFLQFF